MPVLTWDRGPSRTEQPPTSHAAGLAGQPRGGLGCVSTSTALARAPHAAKISSVPWVMWAPAWPNLGWKCPPARDPLTP